jgi:isopenicillin-N N-acyltransferase like protein
MRTVEINGPPGERGRSYGMQARDLIAQAAAYYLQLLTDGGIRTAAELLRSVMRWEPAIEQSSADLAEELRGIAEGSGRPLAEIIMLNARSELLRLSSVAGDGVDGCTVFGLIQHRADGDAPFYVGGNWDWREGTRDHWLLLRIVQPPKPTVTTVVEAGQLARFGVNSAGIAVFANGLNGFRAGEAGLPQLVVRRRVLDSADFSSALAVAIETRRCLASNLLLAHRDGLMLDVELAPGRCAWLEPGDGLLVHGNHYEAFSWAADGAEFRPWGFDSLYRTQRLRGRLRAIMQAPETIGPGSLSGCLADHAGLPDSVCRHPNPQDPPSERWITLASSIVDMRSGTWWLAPGQPCETRREAIAWNVFSGNSEATSGAEPC